MKSYIDTALERLRHAGFKITKPKQAVLELLSQSSKALSAYDMRDELKAKNINANAVSMYRILEILEQLGLVHKVLAFNGYVRCDLKNEEAQCHHYAVCKKCHTIEEIEGEDFSAFEKKIERLKKIHLESHYLEFIGTCQKCLDKKV